MALVGTEEDYKKKNYENPGPVDENGYLTGDASKFEWAKGTYFQGPGGGEKAQEFYAFKKFASLFGRNPTPQELAQLSSFYNSGNPNIAAVQQGDAAVIAMYNSPDKLHKRQQEEYGRAAPEKYGEVDTQIQNLLGRGATQEEKDYFGKMLASGQIDAYQLQEFLKQDDEYVSRQDQQFREGLSGELQAGDSRYFQEQLMPAIQSQFAKQGRSVDATGFQNSIAREGTAQNRQRESFLANLSAQQYGGRSGNARADYEGMYNTQARRQEMSLYQPYERMQQLQDYSIQQGAYEDYLRRYGKRSGGGAAGAASGALSGAAAGSAFGPGYGTAIGAVGGGILGYFGGR